MKSFFEEPGLAFLSPLSTLTIVLSIFNLFQTQCQDEFRSLSGGVTKILTACWIFQISIGYRQEMRMIDFRIFGFFTQLEAGCVGICLRLFLKIYAFFSRICGFWKAGPHLRPPLSVPGRNFPWIGDGQHLYPSNPPNLSQKCRRNNPGRNTTRLFFAKCTFPKTNLATD